MSTFACGNCHAASNQPCKVGCPGDIIEITPQGGKHTALDVRCDLFPPAALLKVGKVLHRGAHYGVNNWRLIYRDAHINHALAHVLEYMNGKDESELHNAACRLLFALETDDDPKGPRRATSTGPANGPQKT